MVKGVRHLCVGMNREREYCNFVGDYPTENRDDQSNSLEDESFIEFPEELP